MQNTSSVSNLLLRLNGLAELIQARLQSFFDQKQGPEVSFPLFENGVDDKLSKFMVEQSTSPKEYFLLLIALASHLDPEFFDRAIRENIPKAGDFPQIGGARGKQFRGFLPTGETALFILAGNDMGKRFEVQQLFSEDHFFF